jgi:hypothetical protein
MEALQWIAINGVDLSNIEYQSQTTSQLPSSKRRITGEVSLFPIFICFTYFPFIFHV